MRQGGTGIRRRFSCPAYALLELGFASSIRKEYAWRVSRGESTRNLDAFSHLIERSSDG
ncbi:hypothetical protein SMICM304S_08089 [Streptomyces microflavus]